MQKETKNSIPSYTFVDTSAEDKLADVLIWDRVLYYDFHKPHAHEYHEILFFYRGGGAHLLGDQWVDIDQYDIHIIPAQFVHQLQRSSQSEGFTLAFSHAFLLQLFGHSQNTNLSKLIDKPTAVRGNRFFFDENSYYFKELFRQRKRKQVFYNIASILLLNIYHNFFENTDSEKPGFGDFGVLFIQLLNTHFIQHRKVNFYASELGMGKSMLNDQLQKHFGKSFKELHQEKLIITAKQKILHENKGIAEIAYQLGFVDPAYFSRFFKRHTGQSPKSYKSTQ